MELHYSPTTLKQAYTAPPCVARYCPVFWEPIAGTGERIVALVCLEPHESSSKVVSAGTHPVLPVERLRAMLGRQRGNATHNVLREVASFMTERQAAGMPISELDSPFQGFAVGPIAMARGYTVEQLLNAAVRTVSAFGSAEDLVEEEKTQESPHNTVRTSEFLRTLKRFVAGEDKNIIARFERRLQVPAQQLDITVDYAYKQWMVQVTSLPATPNQFVHALREAQSKLYEVDKLRRGMDGNEISPVLLVNEDVLNSDINERGLAQANEMLERLRQLSKADDLQLMQASNPHEAATLVNALA